MNDDVIAHMTDEELNLELYRRLLSEQESFRDELLSLPPEQILSRAYEYAVREDIVMSLEETDLSGRQARALLKSGHPLQDIFLRWENSESSHMEEIRSVIENEANRIIRSEFMKSRADAR